MTKMTEKQITASSKRRVSNALKETLRTNINSLRTAGSVSTDEAIGKQEKKILESIPKVGPSAAGNLLHTFSGLGGLLRASEQEIARVTDVGPLKAKIIFDALGPARADALRKR
jgi:ERCC4-type nuclease